MLSDSLIASSIEVFFFTKEDSPFFILVELDDIRKAIKSIEKAKGTSVKNCPVVAASLKVNVTTHVPFSLVKGLDAFFKSQEIEPSLMLSGNVNVEVEGSFLTEFYSTEHSFVDGILHVYPRFNERKFLLHLKELTDQDR